MIRVGLTGNIGSGKSLVCKVFEELGVPVYYADERAKIILDSPEVQQRLVKRYGADIMEAGHIRRKKLASIVFQSKEELAFLNQNIHPALQKDMEIWFAQCGDIPYAIQEAAILFENSFEHLFDKIIVVSAPLELRLERVMKRDHTSREAVLQRVQNQWEESRKTALADEVIVNDGKRLLLPQILSIHRRLTGKK